MRVEEHDGSMLNIHRLRPLYLVPYDHPAPDVLAKLDAIARRTLPHALSSAVSRSLPNSTEDVWMIRSLKLDVDLNLDSNEDQLALNWARQAAIALAEILGGDSEANEVLHFANRAAYLAHFLRDLVDGSAWGKWYYRQFEGLRLLPLSAALRTAICREVSMGREALLQLTSTAVRRIVTSLTDNDAQRVLDELSDVGVRPQSSPLSELVNPSTLNHALRFDREEHAALTLYLQLCKDHPETAGPKLFVRAVACLMRLSRALPSAHLGPLLRALTTSDVASLYQSAGPADAERLTPLLGYPSDWLRNVTAPTQFATPSSSSEPRRTSNGGIFFLLPLLDAMPLDQATSNWPELYSSLPASLVRWLLLMKCSGTTGAAQIFHDPLIRDLLGITPEIDPPSLRQWQRALSPKQLLSFQNEIARWQMDNSFDSQPSISLFIAARKPQSVLCCDLHHRLLLLALPDSRSSRELLLRTLSAWPAAPAPEQASNASEETPPHSSASPSHLFVPPIEGSDLQNLLDDFNFLNLPPALRGCRRSDLTFSVAARALLRKFSGRLPGFSHSSLHHLHRNFLDVSATLQTQCVQNQSAPHRTVHLSRPPLHVVLSLAGMNRQSYSLSWTDGAFALFTE
jgi:hypothetical protein